MNLRKCFLKLKFHWLSFRGFSLFKHHASIFFCSINLDSLACNLCHGFTLQWPPSAFLISKAFFFKNTAYFSGRFPSKKLIKLSTYLFIRVLISFFPPTLCLKEVVKFYTQFTCLVDYFLKWVFYK